MVSGLILLVLAAAAAVVCFLRARRLAVGRTSWLAFGFAGVAAALGHLIWLITGDPALASWVLVGAFAAFALGTALAIYEIDHADALDVVLDTALVLGIATVVVFRWAPAPHELITGALHALPTETRVTVLLAPIAAVASVLFSLILLTENRHAASLGIAGASICFAIATVPFAVDGSCCSMSTPLVLTGGAGWLFLAYAALRRTQPITSDQPELSAWWQRSAIAPLVAVIMASVLIDAALRPPLPQATAVVLGVVGLLLGVRVAQLLHFTRSRSRERRELAQNRALIEVSHSLAGTTDLETTLEQVTELACRLLRAKAASLELLTPDSNTLELKSATGLPSAAIGMRFPVQGSFTGWVVQCGTGRTANDLDGEPLIGPESRRILGHSPIASVPLRHRGMTLGALSCIGKAAFGSNDLELMGALADQAAIAIENARLFEQVRALSLTDPLTTLANRRQLERDLTREFAAAKRGRRLVAVMFDLNAFKSYNDRFGHLAGDRVLRIFGEALAHETRAMNLAARYGGDEFLVLLTDSTTQGAAVFVDRVKHEFKIRAAGLPNHEFLAVEAGIAEYEPDMENEEDLIAAADRALYENKASRSSV